MVAIVERFFIGVYQNLF